ncbi:MAG: TonB-dependent receptor [Gemmatimonadota bacterium]|nr:TonB-dependent receptor [Gemmatimonadota bacterium]
MQPARLQPARLQPARWHRRAVRLGLACGAFVPALLIGAQTTPPNQDSPSRHADFHTAVVRGTVRDSALGPISYATVVWGSSHQTTRTDDAGSFEIGGLASGETHFTVRRLGYIPLEFDLTLRSGVTRPIVLYMVPVAAPLPGVSVSAASDSDADAFRAARFAATGFFDRMRHHPGYFIPPEEVERRKPAYISDLMYAVPGVTMVGAPRSGSLRYLSSGGQCRLRLYLDGQPVPDGDDFVPGSDIKGVEVYNSLLNVPQAFMPSPAKGYCGSVIVWTK